MNRVEELELTVQLLLDKWPAEIDEELEYSPTPCETAESILASRPCCCAELPFPHKRSRACFMRYSR